LVELRPQIVGLSRSQFYFLLYFFDNMPFYVNREEYRVPGKKVPLLIEILV